ncbi:nucleoside 2-deoxyribosyltransferase [Xenorhabdus szentirmaii]|uniref:Nucleoside 2-deoxyribosyltransferase n=2 Tax=Xenorhabdus szentirmaii TaxID=290112 RepID=W1IT76_9GAMM|nr:MULTISPECIES: nucleoside 2-deoxyribosyltransferase [Xenorhabdus]MBD2782008.1 nucleoside 2-deoxyribosyltransferase [Xenorhabdus sp. 38]MBD2791148.1 nucleoside 2-deoxyribosyltransferase [Xenorhabdus sp. CUL]MBD2799618.1 nucleoside 2-deoxyribosyltransferase [Xenorhabdus sp. M]MBD2805652.1 nucleoside 2-deoxyribosyltransferase [Xenorhabdus sp. ZM]MBD2821053.1 nucleoside 2-deoxyribosyltransferase [Xenorhabdus sp. 42]
MSKLFSNLNVFIGGPIQHALKLRALDSDLQAHIKSAIYQLESLGAEVFSAHRTEQFGGATHLFTPEEVSQRDLQWMKQCDIFVAILPTCRQQKQLIRTDGTHIELGWASALNRPIILVTEKPFCHSASHLLKGLSAVAQVHHICLNDFEHDPAILIHTMQSIIEKTASLKYSATA